MALASDDRNRFRTILAITFTNKAAAEMKERVISVLNNLSGREPDKHLLGTIATELGTSPETIQRRAGNTLRAILHNYSDFSIGTIDSFMHRVVRTFAHDLKLPVNFSVELDQSVLLQEAVADVLSKVGEDASITRALVGFAEHRTDEEKSVGIEDDLYNTASDLLQEEKAERIRKLKALNVEDLMGFREVFAANCRRFEEQLRAIGNKALVLIEKAGLEPGDFYRGRSGIGGFLAKLSVFGPDSEFKLNTYVKETLAEGKWYPGKASPSLQNSIDSVKDEVAALAQEAVQLWEEQGSQYSLQLILKDSLFTIALLNEISQAIDKIREEKFIVHISEFNRRVQEVVFNEPAPFVFERLGERYQHFLIDEFQDTSILQWQNLLPLVQNGLAGNNPSLVVGDGKQAIYRFRGGDVEQFALLPEPYPESLSPLQKERYLLLKQLFSPGTLKTNYRSKPEVIRFNNNLYRFLSTQFLSEVYSSVYLELEQEPAPNKTGGYVQIKMLEGGLSALERDEQNLNHILSTIQDLINSKGYILSDIAILTRKNAQGALIAEFLLANDVPVVSSESLLVAGSPEVSLLVSWLHILTGENVQLNYLSTCIWLIEKGKVHFKGIEELLPEYRMNEDDFSRLLSEQGMELDFARLRSTSILEACHILCRSFGIDIQNDIYVQFFLEAIWNLCNKISADIPAFLDWWDENKEKLSISLPQDSNAVRIMSMHKSKGLQFPVVILPFITSEHSKSSYQWVSDSEYLPASLPAARLPLTAKLSTTKFGYLYEEESNRKVLDSINLLYVATTRAEDSLYIISTPTGRSGGVVAGWEQYIKEFAEQFGDADENGIFEWGSAAYRNERVTKTKIEPKIQEIYPTGNWQDRIRISRLAPRIWETLSEPALLLRGKLIHTALSWIRYEEDIPLAVERLLTEGYADMDKLGDIEREVREVVTHPRLNKYYRPGLKVRNERELLMPDGTLFRPDRVVEVEDTLVILDYKTGRIQVEHKSQVLGYLSAIRNLHPSVKAYLVYLHNPTEIIEVQLSPLVP